MHLNSLAHSLDPANNPVLHLFFVAMGDFFRSSYLQVRLIGQQFLRHTCFAG